MSHQSVTNCQKTLLSCRSPHGITYNPHNTNTHTLEIYIKYIPITICVLPQKCNKTIQLSHEITKNCFPSESFHQDNLQTQKENARIVLFVGGQKKRKIKSLLTTAVCLQSGSTWSETSWCAWQESVGPPGLSSRHTSDFPSVYARSPLLSWWPTWESHLSAPGLSW